MKPTAFSLSASAVREVFADKPLFWASMKYALPMTILATMLGLAGKTFGYAWAEYAVMPLVLYAYACYALTWHRHSLRGADGANIVSPVRAWRENLRFIIYYFLVMTALPVLLAVVAGLVVSFVASVVGKIPAIILGAVLFVGATYLFMRIWFVLPAQSVGVRLPVKDVKRASRGLLLPLFGANFILALLFIIAALVYMTAVGAALGIATGGNDIEKTNILIISLITILPVQLGVYTMMAFVTVALSRAYQWGAQNNAIAAAD